VPQVADRAEPFVSRVRAGLAGRTAEPEQLAVEMYARGLSTRDIEAASRDASGARASRDASGARASRDASGASVETACSERPGAVKREA
jgi:hypothetical protein